MQGINNPAAKFLKIAFENMKDYFQNLYTRKQNMFINASMSSNKTTKAPPPMISSSAKSAHMKHDQMSNDKGLNNNIPSNAAPDFNALLMDIGKNQNRTSFITLFEHYAPRIKSFLIKRGFNNATADEMAQETMLTIWNKAAAFDVKKASAGTWIYTIARNKSIDYLRKERRADTVSFEPYMIDETEDENSPADNTQHTQEKDIIEMAIKNLPPTQADLIFKSFFEGKTHNEIADETGIALGTVKSRIRLALERLRGDKQIKDLEIEGMA